MSVVVVTGYIHNIQRLIIEQIIPNELYSMVSSYYYGCMLIKIQDASNDNSSHKSEWNKYWKPNQLYDRYMPIKRVCDFSFYGVTFKGRSTINTAFNGLFINTEVMIHQFFDHCFYELLRELRILRCLDGHPSIIKLYDILSPIDSSKFNSLTIVLEAVGTNLEQIFKSNQYFSDFQVKYILYHMLLGINYIHGAGIAHRNLKPANVLINADCSVKICNFVLAVGFDENMAVGNKKLYKKTRMNLLKKSNANIANYHRYRLKNRSIRRWYQAPEVILFQKSKEYSQSAAIDMWSIGCIFGELLQMQKENCSIFGKRGPLFPAYTCFAISVRDFMENGTYQIHYDQLCAICHVLGTPTKEDIALLCGDEKFRTYLHDLPKQCAQNLAEMFPATDEYGINLLQSLLKFHPKTRINGMEAIKYRYFDRLSNIDLEKIQCRLKLNYNKKGLTPKQSRKLILEDIRCQIQH